MTHICPAPILFVTMLLVSTLDAVAAPVGSKGCDTPLPSGSCGTMGKACDYTEKDWPISQQTTEGNPLTVARTFNVHVPL